MILHHSLKGKLFLPCAGNAALSESDGVQAQTGRILLEHEGMTIYTLFQDEMMLHTHPQTHETDMPIPWIKVAGTIYQVGKVLLTGKELTEHVNAILKERKRGMDGQEQISSQMQQIEEALARQAELHRQHQIQMELMHTALQDLQKSLRWALALAGLSLMLGLAAIFWAAFR